MDTDRQTKQISYQHQPAVSLRLVSHLFPLQNRPKHNGSAHLRHRINLTLNRRKPKRISKGISQSTYGTSTHDRPNLSHRNNISTHRGRVLSILPLRHLKNHQFLSQSRDGPKQKQNGKSTRQRRHDIHHFSRLRHIISSKQGKYPTNHLKQRSSRRVTHL